MNLAHIDQLIHSCKLQKALEVIIEERKKLSNIALTPNHLHLTSKLLFVLSELRDVDQIERTSQELKDFAEFADLKIQAEVEYLLGLCAAYQGNLNLAVEHCNESIQCSLAIKSETPYNHLALALAGRVACFARMGQFETGLKDVENLKILKSNCDLETRVAIELNSADFYSRVFQTNLAWDHLQNAKIFIREQKSLFNQIKSATIKSELYEQTNNLSLAIETLEFADTLCDPNEMRYRSGRILENIQRLKTKLKQSKDLIIDTEKRFILEKKLGQIEIRQQHVLQLLLSELSKKEGKPLSKPQICRLIWNEDYAPSTHDNKIYVTIKRLRDLVEPDPHKPKYIQRSRDGYYLATSEII